jgi:integrase
MNVGDGTIRRELSVLRAALRWQDPNTKAVVALPPAAPPKDRYLTTSEFQSLLAAAQASHVKLFIVLALATAARKEALLTLTWDRVDLSRGIINLGRGVRQKGRAVVPVNDFAREWLQKAQAAAVSDFVIEWAGGAVASIRTGFDAACAKAGFTDVTPHVLRHTAAVWMAEAGVRMSEIAQYLGHRDSRTTERVYARYSPEYLQTAAAALDPRRA